MSESVTCDRCGARQNYLGAMEHELMGWRRASIPKIRTGDYLDLCPKCSKAFDEFMKGDDAGLWRCPNTFKNTQCPPSDNCSHCAVREFMEGKAE